MRAINLNYLVFQCLCQGYLEIQIVRVMNYSRMSDADMNDRLYYLTD